MSNHTLNDHTSLPESIVMPVVRPEIQSYMTTLSSWHARPCISELRWSIVASGHTPLCSPGWCKEGPSEASPRKFAINLFRQEVEIIFGDTRQHDIGVQILTDVSVCFIFTLETQSSNKKSTSFNMQWTWKIVPSREVEHRVKREQQLVEPSFTISPGTPTMRSHAVASTSTYKDSHAVTTRSTQ